MLPLRGVVGRDMDTLTPQFLRVANCASPGLRVEAREYALSSLLSEFQMAGTRCSTGLVPEKAGRCRHEKVKTEILSFFGDTCDQEDPVNQQGIKAGALVLEEGIAVSERP